MVGRCYQEISLEVKEEELGIIKRFRDENEGVYYLNKLSVFDGLRNKNKIENIENGFEHVSSNGNIIIRYHSGFVEIIDSKNGNLTFTSGLINDFVELLEFIPCILAGDNHMQNDFYIERDNDFNLTIATDGYLIVLPEYEIDEIRYVFKRIQNSI